MLITAIGDVHQTGKSPVCRIDDLTETQFNKWEEIRDFANKKNTPIISVGDIFHVSVVANSIVNKVGSILNGLQNPLYFVWGNHDLLYHSIDLWNRTSLGVLLQNHPKVKHISSFKQDYGIHWAFIDWDNPLRRSDHSKFLLSHKAIINYKQLKSNFWIEKDQSFAKPIGQWAKDYKLVLCGHWHKPYSFKKDNTIVINPGPVSRMTVEDNLMPSICLINLNTLLFKRHYLESAKPFDEVVSENHLNTKIDQTSSIREFIDKIKNKASNYDSAFMEELMNIINGHKLDRAIENVLLDILATTKERSNK